MGAVNSKDCFSGVSVWTTLGLGLGFGALYYYYATKNAESGLGWSWGGTETRRPIRGLRNIGSTCYLNAVLQAMSSCVYFGAWLAYKDDENRCDFPPRLHHISEYKRFDYPVIAVLYRAVLVIGNDIEDSVLMAKVPKDLVQTLRAIKGVGKFFSTTNVEQDTFECMQCLLTILHLEVARSVFRRQRGTVESILDEDDASEVSGELISISETEPAADLNKCLPPPMTTQAHSIGASISATRVSETAPGAGWDMVYDPKKAVNRIFSKRRESVTMDLNIPLVPKFPFRGLTANVMQCLQCLQKLPVKLEAFESLTLLMPTGITVGTRLTIRSLLQDLLKLTIVTQVDCEGCSLKQGKPTKSAFSKRMCIARFPAVLVFHILQSQWTYNTLSKRYDTVKYEESLNIGDLADWIDVLKSDACIKDYDLGAMGDPSANGTMIHTESPRAKKINYKLQALIAHNGDANSGHFFTCRRIPDPPSLPVDYEWAFVSDDYVANLEAMDPFQYRPYLLFYEKSE